MYQDFKKMNQNILRYEIKAQNQINVGCRNIRWIFAPIFWDYVNQGSN